VRPAGSNGYRRVEARAGARGVGVGSEAGARAIGAAAVFIALATAVGVGGGLPLPSAAAPPDRVAMGFPAGPDQAAAAPGAARLFAAGGEAAAAPENTLAAIRAAVDAGIPRIWVDVRETSDGVPVLLRDAELDRTTDCSGPVSGISASELAGCDAGGWFGPDFAGEEVPELAEALAVPGVTWLLNLAEGDPERVLGLARTAGVLDGLQLIASRAADVAAIAAVEPGVEVYLDVTAASAWRDARDAGAAGMAVSLDGGVDGTALLAARSAGLALALSYPADERSLRAAAAFGPEIIASPRAEAGLLALAWSHRALGPEDLGRTAEPDQGFPTVLAEGDFNADGVDDLVVGAPRDSARVPGGGWLGVIMGGPDFPARRFVEFKSEAEGRWGSTVAVGDWNADGRDDLVIGYPQGDFVAPDGGGLWLWEGSPTGMRSVPRPFGPAVEAGDQLGAALAVGDLDGDGIDDLAASAPGKRVDGRLGAGRVYVIPGRRDAGPIVGPELVFDRSLEEVEGEPIAREGLGSALALTDLDGDGRDDLVVGVPEAEVDGMRAAGALLLAYGAAPDDGGNMQADRFASLVRGAGGLPGEPERNGRFGAVLVAADLDGDGFGDLVAGAPDATVGGARTAGDAVVVHGGVDGPDLARFQLLRQGIGAIADEPEVRDAFASSLAIADLNGDARPDLLIGAPGEALAGMPGAGLGLALLGGPGGLDPRRALSEGPDGPPVSYGLVSNLGFGAAAVGGDFNGDGEPDVAWAAPGQAQGGQNGVGALWMAWGYSPSLPAVPTASPTVPASPTTAPSATPTPSPTGPSPTPTDPVTPSVTPTRAPTATPRPRLPAYVPYAARLHPLGFYPPAP